MSPQGDVTKAAGAIRSASALTEVTFLRAGQTLEASSGILAELTSRFAAVLEELEGEKPGHALQALLEISARVTSLGQTQLAGKCQVPSKCAGSPNQLTAASRKMKVSLKHVDLSVSECKDCCRGYSFAGNRFHHLRK